MYIGGRESVEYFHHEGLRIVTDLDLRGARALETLTEMMNGSLCSELSPPAGWELWLPNELPGSDVPLRYVWVHHEMRVSTSHCPKYTGEYSVTENIGKIFDMYE